MWPILILVLIFELSLFADLIVSRVPIFHLVGATTFAISKRTNFTFFYVSLYNMQISLFSYGKSAKLGKTIGQLWLSTSGEKNLKWLKYCTNLILWQVNIEKCSDTQSLLDLGETTSQEVVFVCPKGVPFVTVLFVTISLRI